MVHARVIRDESLGISDGTAGTTLHPATPAGAALAGHLAVGDCE